MMSRDGIAIAFCGKSKRSCPVMDGNATLFSGRRRRRRGRPLCCGRIVEPFLHGEEDVLR